MHADHDQTLVPVLFGPGADIGDRAQAVDAGIGPEIDQHDLALERLAVSGGELSHARAGERRQLPLDSARMPVDGAARLARVGSGIAGPVMATAAAFIAGSSWRSGVAAASSARYRSSRPRAGPGASLSTKPCSSERRAGERDLREEPVSRPNAIATTAASTATPRPRRIHSPAPERALHRGKHPAADQQRERQRGRRARGIGEQQEGRLRARALQRRAGQDQPQHRTGARRPQQPGRNAEQQRRHDRPPLRSPLLIGRLRQRAPSATSGRVRRSASAGNSSVSAEQRQQRDRRVAGRTRSPARPSRRRPRPASRQRRMSQPCR